MVGSENNQPKENVSQQVGGSRQKGRNQGNPFLVNTLVYRGMGSHATRGIDSFFMG